MPTRSGQPYLLGESSKSHTTQMDLQQIAAIFAEISAKLENLKTIDERLTKVEVMREPPESPTGDQTPPRNDVTTPMTHPISMLNIWKTSRSMSPTLMDITTHNFL